MAVRKKPEENPEPLPPPARTLEGREDQLIAAAYDLAERRIHNETASAQEVVHFLRLGSRRNHLEQTKIEHENLVLQARVKEMEARKSQEQLLEKALAAFKGYSGQEPIDPEEDGYADELYY